MSIGHPSWGRSFPSSVVWPEDCPTDQERIHDVLMLMTDERWEPWIFEQAMECIAKKIPGPDIRYHPDQKFGTNQTVFIFFKKDIEYDLWEGECWCMRCIGWESF